MTIKELAARSRAIYRDAIKGWDIPSVLKDSFVDSYTEGVVASFKNFPDIPESVVAEICAEVDREAGFEASRYAKSWKLKSWEEKVEILYGYSVENRVE